MDSARTNSLVIFTHIYRCAGSSLVANFLPYYSPEQRLGLNPSKVSTAWQRPNNRFRWNRETVRRYVATNASGKTRLISGHLAHIGLHWSVPTNVTPYYIIFLRDPYERIVSLYRYHLGKEKGPWHEELTDNAWSPEEWLRNSSMPWCRNGQLRQLIWHEYPEVLQNDVSLTHEHLLAGKRMLEQYDYIGLVEHFEDDAHYLFGKFNLWKSAPKWIVNASYAKTALPKQALTLLAESNQLDLSLYEFANERRQHFVRNNRLRYWHFRRKARILRAFSEYCPKA